jgi:hypothetical protein
MLFLHGAMYFFFQNKKSKRQSGLKIQDRLQKILNLKTIDALLKFLIAFCHVIYWITMYFRNLAWTKFLSVLTMGLLGVDILVITGTLITRLIHMKDEEYKVVKRKTTVKEVI